MRSLLSAAVLVSCFGLALPSKAQNIKAEAKEISFLSCPIYRHTNAGRKSGCWLAQDPKTGVRYDVTKSPTNPDWNFGVLVEGIISDTQDVDACGAVVLNPVRVSKILEQQCTPHLLPAEQYKGRPYKRGKYFPPPLLVKRDAPKPPFNDQVFHAYFDYGSDFLIYQYGDFLVEKAQFFMRHAKPSRIDIIGYAQTVPVKISDQKMAETSALAGRRAQRVKQALIQYGIPKDKITIHTDTNPKTIKDPDQMGLDISTQRRVDIHARFKP